MKNNHHDQTVLVTGASSGIGLAIARQFAEHQYRLVLVSRNLEKLDLAAEDLRKNGAPEVTTIALDLARPDAAQTLLQNIEERKIQIDILINNAGTGLYGEFTELPLEKEIQMMQLNMLTLASLTKLFLQPMLERGHGRILNVASLVAYQPGGPHMATYYATKAFVLSFCKGLSVELRGTGVTVTALCPGPTKTAFEETSGAAKTFLYRLPKTSPRRVARAAFRATRSGRRVAIPGLLSKILAFAGELPPRRIALEVNNLLLKSTR